MFAHSSCPQVQELERLMLGQIADPLAEVLEQHVSQCPRCESMLDNLRSSDTLLEAVRRQATVVLDPEEPVIERLIERIREATGPTTIRAACFPHDTPYPGATLSEDVQPAADLESLLDPPERPGEIGRLGPYRLLRLLGAGGMGVVYQARQQRPRRMVALKVLATGPHVRLERLLRFRKEAEAVAQLQHSNIVQIYAVGEHAGRPYFAMEFVSGGSLEQHLGRKPIPARTAAQLVETLARAIQYAHERGIVHRDLKPANILVQKEEGGRIKEEQAPQRPDFVPPNILPKIADFGLAKHLAEESASATAVYRTQSGAILGTPEYMAPEQAAGQIEQVGPAADIYALGAILYEALTGRPPFRAATILETLEQARSQEPVAPDRLEPGLPTDIQTICLKCLEKEPAKRYGSALALAHDLARFLDGRPISARPITAWERSRKWAKRKPAAAGLLAVSAIALGVFVAGMLWHNAKLRQAVHQAEIHETAAQHQQELATARYRAARNALNRILERLEAQPLAEVPRFKELQSDLVADALTFYQATFKEQENPDPAVRVDLAWICKRAATIQQQLGHLEAAGENYRRALDLVEGLPAEDREARGNQLLVAATYDNLGLLANIQKKWAEAERYHRAALAINERLVQELPTDPMSLGGVAQSEHNLGVVCQLVHQWSEARSHYDRAVLCRKTLLRDNLADENQQASLAEDYLNLALICQCSGQANESTPMYRKAEELLRPLVARHPGQGQYALSLAGLYNNWAMLYRDTRQLPQALAKHDLAVELAEAVIRQEPNYNTARLRVYQTRGARAESLDACARFADAVKDWDRVLQLAPIDTQTDMRIRRASSLVRGGDHAQAVREAREVARAATVSDDECYNLACVWALAVGPARSDARLPEADRAALGEQYALQAVELLQKLHTKGYFKNTKSQQLLKTDQDLQSLRDREGFRRLLSSTATNYSE